MTLVWPRGGAISPVTLLDLSILWTVKQSLLFLCEVQMSQCVKILSGRQLYVVVTLQMSLKTKWQTCIFTIYSQPKGRINTKKIEMFVNVHCNIMTHHIRSSIFKNVIFSYKLLAPDFLLHGNLHTRPLLAEYARTKQAGHSHSLGEREGSQSKMAGRFRNTNTGLRETEKEK